MTRGKNSLSPLSKDSGMLSLLYRSWHAPSSTFEEMGVFETRRQTRTTASELLSDFQPRPKERPGRGRTKAGDVGASSKSFCKTGPQSQEPQFNEQEHLELPISFSYLHFCLLSFGSSTREKFSPSSTESCFLSTRYRSEAMTVSSDAS